MFVLKKILFFLVLAVIGSAFVGWLPPDRARRFVQGMIALFVIGFVWRVSAWLMAGA